MTAKNDEAPCSEELDDITDTTTSDDTPDYDAEETNAKEEK